MRLCLMVLGSMLAVSTTAAAGPPAVIALVEQMGPGDPPRDLALLGADGSRAVLLDHLPLGGYQLAVHPGTGRWALSFGQLSNGDPLVIAGKAVSKPLDRNTLVLGDRDGVVTITAGDPGCTSKKRACFETPRWFSTDGAYVFILAESSSRAVLSRWVWGKRPTRAAITDARHGGLALAPDLTRASYVADDGVHVIALAPQKAKATKVTLSPRAVVNPRLLMSDAWPIGSRLYWFRREPAKQQRGYFEAYDLDTGRTVALHEATADFPMMRGGFLATGARGTVIFGDDVGFERFDVYETTADGARAIAHDVHQLLDVSADGRYLLATRRTDPAHGEALANPESLVIIDLDSDQDVATLAVGAAAKVDQARFIAR